MAILECTLWHLAMGSAHKRRIFTHYDEWQCQSGGNVTTIMTDHLTDQMAPPGIYAIAVQRQPPLIGSWLVMGYWNGTDLHHVWHPDSPGYDDANLGGQSTSVNISTWPPKST